MFILHRQHLQEIRENKFATDIIHHGAVITNRCPKSSLRWLKYMNASCLGGGKGNGGKEGRKENGEMVGG